MLKFTGHFSQGIVDPRANGHGVGSRSRVMIDMGGGNVASVYGIYDDDTTAITLNYNVFSVEGINKVVASGSYAVPSFDSIASPTATLTFPMEVMPWTSAPLGAGRTILILGSHGGQGVMLLTVDTTGDRPSFGPPIPLIDAGDIQHAGDTPKGWAGHNSLGSPFDPGMLFGFNTYAIIPRSFSEFDIVISSDIAGQVALRSYTVSSGGVITPDGALRYAWDGGSIGDLDGGLTAYEVSVPLPSRQVMIISGYEKWVALVDVAKGTIATKRMSELNAYHCGGTPTLTTRGDVEMVAVGPDGWPAVVTISVPGMSVKVKSFESLGITRGALKSLGIMYPATWSANNLPEPGATPTRPLPGPLWTVASWWWAPGTSPEGPNSVGSVGVEQAAGMVNYGGPAVSTGHRTGTPGDDGKWNDAVAGFGNFLVTDTHILNWRHYYPEDLVVSCWRYRNAGNLKPGAARRKGYFS